MLLVSLIVGVAANRSTEQATPHLISLNDGLHLYPESVIPCMFTNFQWKVSEKFS